MLKVHELRYPEGAFGVSVMACGREGVKRREKWQYQSRSGKTQFQAVLPGVIADDVPRVTCAACLKLKQAGTR